MAPSGPGRARPASAGGRLARGALRVAAASIVLVTVACAHSIGRGGANGAEGLYALALEELEGGLLPEAQKDLEDLRAQYPYSRFAALAELRLGDVLLRRGRHLEAIDAYRQFLQLHPTHPLADYALLQVAEAHYSQLPQKWWLLPPECEKDQTPTHQAIDAYQQMLARFPRGPSSDAARQRLAACRRRLADHELYVADFYLRRHQPAGARGRAEGLLRDYAGLGLDARALWIVARAALEEGDLAAARAAAGRLADAFAATPEAAQVRRLGL